MFELTSTDFVMFFVVKFVTEFFVLWFFVKSKKDSDKSLGEARRCYDELEYAIEQSALIRKNFREARRSVVSSEDRAKIIEMLDILEEKVLSAYNLP